MTGAPETAIAAERPRAGKPWSWLAGAFAVALLIALLETRLREMQSALLAYFLAAFWLALPRRVWLIGLVAAVAAAPFIVHPFTGVAQNWSAGATIAAIALGAVAGTLGGTAFVKLDPPAEEYAMPGPRRRGSTVGARTLLPLALTAFAALGVAPVWASLRMGAPVLGLLPAPRLEVTLVAVRWAQALSIVWWVLLTPLLLRARKRLHVGGPEARETVLTLAELSRHVMVIVLVAVAHAAALAILGVLIGSTTPVVMGELPSFARLWFAALAAYGPFDLLTYIAILGLAYLTDRARQAEDARRRAVALEATAVSARLSALKARLDPHFLYNALNAAVTLARRGDGEGTSRVLEELTALLRYVLDDTRAWVVLNDELAFVHRYLEIMQLRFGARLTFSVASEGGTDDAPVPPLILQPLVENAVEHGVANATGPVTVRVAARRDGDRLVLTVEDDGPGPDAASTPGAGIGLASTRERLAMLFGDRASLTLAPRVPRGALTELTLPTSAPAAS